MRTRGEPVEVARRRRIREHLESAPPADWMAAIATLQDDGTTELVEWMARHPRLEVGMAKALYWMLRPGDYVTFATENQMTAGERDVWRVLRIIEARYIQERLAPSTVAFDPAHDPHDGYDWTADYDRDAAVPGAALPLLGLFVAEPGQAVDGAAHAESTGWHRGAPPLTWPEAP